MYSMKQVQTDSAEIKAIKRYIELTPAPKLSTRSIECFEVRGLELKELVIMGSKDINGLVDAIFLALDYGRAKGLRMGRKEATKKTE